MGAGRAGRLTCILIPFFFFFSLAGERGSAFDVGPIFLDVLAVYPKVGRFDFHPSGYQFYCSDMRVFNRDRLRGRSPSLLHVRVYRYLYEGQCWRARAVARRLEEGAYMHE